jgi:Aldehyde dehydrogenase family
MRLCSVPRPSAADIELALDIGRQEGAQALTGGARAHLAGELAEGCHIQPTIFAGHNKMRIFQEEIFGPAVSVTKFKDEAEALAIANDTPYGLGAGVWTRNGNRAYRFGREVQAGRVWTNCYRVYPAHADGSSPMRYPAGEFRLGPAGRLSRRNRGLSLVYGRGAVRILAPHLADHRRRSRTRRRLFARGPRRRALSDAQPGFRGRRGGGTRCGRRAAAGGLFWRLVLRQYKGSAATLPYSHTSRARA